MILNHILDALRKLICWAAIFVGLPIYLFTARTPEFAYQVMVKLFCLTRGASNDFISSVIRVVKRRFEFDSQPGVLSMAQSVVERPRVIRQLHDRGYYVFERALPPEFCDQ